MNDLQENDTTIQEIMLPGSTDEPDTSLVGSSLVIVGANGSGKSRMGIWIEENQPNDREVFRIAAQRSLMFDDRINPMYRLQAETTLLHGSFPNRPGQTDQQVKERARTQRRRSRWQDRPALTMQNDFNVLLSTLVARENKRNEDLANTAKKHGVERGSVPDSTIDKVMRVWAKVMPHRQIAVNIDRVTASPEENPASSYAGSEMSDGERVALYLIGQSMCAPKGAIIVVDEPEVHLHKAIQSDIWNAIEVERRDCQFVYITHNLDFAANRGDVKHLWVKSFDGTKWDWQWVDEFGDLPKDLILEVLGSRQPVLFVEGEKGSIDTLLYTHIYPEHHIIPSGSCEKVIQLTCAMRAADCFHGKEAFGLIDRDYRSDEEISSIEKNHVFVTPVAEAENVFCLPCVLEAATEAVRGNVENVLREAAQKANAELTLDMRRQITGRAFREVQYLLGKFAKQDDHVKDEFVKTVASFTQSIDAEGVYSEAEAVVFEAQQSSDLLKILRVFKRKGLYRQLRELSGMKRDAYDNWVIQELMTAESAGDRNCESGKLLRDLREIFPTIPTRI